ncbi:DNA repair protein Swi5/Sae3, partial [Tremellales sp. Uapishka_1]
MPAQQTSSNRTPSDKLVLLQKENAEWKSKLSLEQAEAIVQKHIKDLHVYNETKDAVQSLIGRYAQMTDQTIRQVHEDMGLSLTE